VIVVVIIFFLFVFLCELSELLGFGAVVVRLRLVVFNNYIISSAFSHDRFDFLFFFSHSFLLFLSYLSFLSHTRKDGTKRAKMNNHDIYIIQI